MDRPHAFPRFPRLPRRLAILAALATGFAAARAATVIDVMVVYTPAAASYNGGTSGINALIQASVASVNTAFTNSGIEARYRLVHAAQTNYTESDSFSTDLGRLRVSGDGYMDEVHTLRATYGADYVVLMRRGPAGNAAGLAYLMSTVNATAFAPYGFSVVADFYSTLNYTFAHELGHGLGCAHDRANSSSAGAYSYSYGYNFNGTNGVNYGTVMCYPGTRIPHFSNPDVSYQGAATGVASGSTAANNALSIASTRSTAGALRATTIGTARADFNGDGENDLVFFNPVNGKRSIWLMDGTSFSTSVILSGENQDWWPSGVGDFDGDGQTDIVFFNKANGSRSIWLMNGTTHTSSVIMPGANLNWEPRACGDFNGDGHTDILFFNPVSGQRSIWLMNRTERASSVILPGANTAWIPGGCGDFNGDGQTDILFFNTVTGVRSIWIMSGTEHVSSVILPGANTAWIPGGCGDYNGDGQTDIIFFNTTTGVRSIWIMNGTEHVTSVILPGSNVDWLPRAF